MGLDIDKIDECENLPFAKGSGGERTPEMLPVRRGAPDRKGAPKQQQQQQQQQQQHLTADRSLSASLFAWGISVASHASCLSVSARIQGSAGFLSQRVWRRPACAVRGPPTSFLGGPPLALKAALLSSPAQEKLALLGDGKDRSGEYVLAEIGGFQRWLEKGRFYDVNRVKQKEGSRLLLLRVLMMQQKEGPTLVGQPFIENIRVWARVLQHFRGPKLLVGKHRPKKWRKRWGHRQALSRIQIEEIEDVGETLGLGRNQEDPLYSVLMAIRRHEKPSLHLPLVKKGGLKLSCRAELPLLGSDPLALLDPKLNQLVADRLAAGQTEIFPILGEMAERERQPPAAVVSPP
ncbi:hypothetical protein Emag_002695 [Eimeria magna]